MWFDIPLSFSGIIVYIFLCFTKHTCNIVNRERSFRHSLLYVGCISQLIRHKIWMPKVGIPHHHHHQHHQLFCCIFSAHLYFQNENGYYFWLVIGNKCGFTVVLRWWCLIELKFIAHHFTKKKTRTGAYCHNPFWYLCKISSN